MRRGLSEKHGVISQKMEIFFSLEFNEKLTGGSRVLFMQEDGRSDRRKD
jgi:hypothetical protein